MLHIFATIQRNSLYGRKRIFLRSCTVSVFFLKFSTSFAYASIGSSNIQTVPIINASTSKDTEEKKGQGNQELKTEYVCNDKTVKCTMWNADKIVNVDPYKDLTYQVGYATLAFPKGRPTFYSADKKLSIAFGAFINYDMGALLGPNKRANGPKAGGFQGTLRRGRPIIVIKYTDFALTITPDIGRFGLQHHDLFGADLKYTGIKHLVIAGGFLPPTLSMMDSETSRGFFLAERPMVVDMLRNIAGGEPRVDFNVIHWGERYLFSIAYTGQRVGKLFKNFQQGQKGGVFRLAGRPIASNDVDLHLGITGTFAVHGENRKYSIISYNESRLFPSAADNKTGTINGVNSIWAIGPEFALRWKRLIFQGEYYSFFMPRKDEGEGHNDNLHFWGWYGSVNYVIFGARRNYLPSRAIFAAPQGSLLSPSTGDWGALEWSARWSYLNLDSHAGDFENNKHGAGIQGGRQKVIATGFNWYPSPHFRVMLDYNYIMASRSRNNLWHLKKENSNLILSRLQITF